MTSWKLPEEVVTHRLHSVDIEVGLYVWRFWRKDVFWFCFRL